MALDRQRVRFDLAASRDTTPFTPAPSDAPFVTTSASPALTAETLISAIILAPDILANRPAASSVPIGSLFSATDVNGITRSNGTTWDDWFS